jgi:hypothetical protein
VPLQKLAFRPGVNKEGTNLSNEGGWFSCDKVRFRSGYPEKIGGWTLDTGTTPSTLLPPAGSFWGVCRSLWNWITLAGYNLAGLGTNLKFYIQPSAGGAFYDVTPLRRVGGTVTPAVANCFTAAYSTLSSGINATATSLTLASGTNFPNAGVVQIDTEIIAYTGKSTNTLTGLTRGYNGTTAATHSSAAGVGSYLLRVSHAGNGSQANDFVTFASAVSLGGNMTASVLNQEFQIVAVESSSVYTVIATAYSTLSSNIGAGDTSITLVSATNFPSSGGVCKVGSEQIYFAGKSGNSLTGLVRGFNGTTAAAHNSGTAIYAPVQATVADTGTGGAATTAQYQITTGNASYTVATGWGAGGWGGVTTGFTSTGWGRSAATGVGVDLRLWTQDNFGQDLIMNPRGGSLYYWAVNSSPTTYDRGQLMYAGGNVSIRGSTVTCDSTTPSLCNFMMISDSSRFVICFGTNDPTGVYATTALDPMQIRWSDQESFSVWTPSITNQAGNIRLSHGSEIISAIQTRQEILVYTDSALYSMQYLGAPYVWGTQILADNISLIGQNAVATVNNVTYWMGTDKFYTYSGRVDTLPCALRQYIFEDINMNEASQVFAGTNEGYNEVWWYYCSSSSNTIDRYVIYNHLERTWYYGSLSRTAWMDSPLRDYPMAAGYNGQLIYHENGVDDGTTNPASPITAYVQSSDFDIGDGHNFGFVWRMIPDVTFNGSYANTPSATFTLLPRAAPGSNYGTAVDPSVTSTQNYTSQRAYEVQQFTQIIYTRARGRQLAFKISSDSLGTQWQLGVPRIDVRADGRR